MLCCLSQECEAFQGECLREESRYHYLHALMGILEVHVDKVKQEEKWEAGDGRLLPEFKSYKELYQNKISQQESLSKQLRKQQKSIKENEAQYTEQVGLCRERGPVVGSERLTRVLGVVMVRLGGNRSGTSRTCATC